mgnify:CR=1 FL=1
MIKGLIRQGDVPLQLDKTGKIRGKKRSIPGRVVLARGESTGHEHVILGEAEVYDLDKPEIVPGYEGAMSATMVLVKGKAKFAHLIGNQSTGEHDTIDIAPGLYWQLTQWEYKPDEIRRMAD